MVMFWNRRYDENGYTRGSLDVITAINLFLKFLLISPILLFAGYVSVAMMKHVIFHGIPSMNKPTEEQQERLREADAEIGMQPEAVVIPEEKEPEVVKVPQSAVTEPPIIAQKPILAVNEYEVYEDCMEKLSPEFRQQCVQYLP